jgi:predicted alpha/beta-fold hydrolase
LSDDIRVALGDEALDEYERIYLLGYSMGGHVVLKYLAEDPDARVRAGAAVCSPLDLEASMRAFDRPSCYLYRRNVLRGLADVYEATAQVERMPSSLTRVRAMRRIFEWDEQVVAPYFGFANPFEYYATQSAGPRLHELSRPALYLGATSDPMVPKRTVAPSLARANARLSIHFHEGGGHMGFPSAFTLGERAESGIEAQVIAWLCQK